MKTKMKNSKLTSIALSFMIVPFMVSCGGAEESATTPGAETKVETTPEVAATRTLDDRINAGKEIYNTTCLACHQAEGQGIPAAFPPLAASDYLNEDVNRAIDAVLHGKTGEITVNGEVYNSVMTPQDLSDEEIADVLTFVYNSWENNKTEVTTEMVTEIKNKN